MARGGNPIGKKSPVSKYALGTSEEIAHRDKVAYQPGGKAFKQMTGGPGGNANEPSRTSKEGRNFKFSNGV